MLDQFLSNVFATPFESDIVNPWVKKMNVNRTAGQGHKCAPDMTQIVNNIYSFKFLEILEFQNIIGGVWKNAWE